MDYVIIVAGGKGTRIGGDLPKQFICLKGKPILMHTIEAFYNYDPQMVIIVVLHADMLGYWQKICAQYHFSIPHQLVIGGDTRFHSVKNGLSMILDKTGVTLVHDAARPFVNSEVIGRVVSLASDGYGVVPVLPVTDSLRFVREKGVSEIADRSKYVAVQTPQGFKSSTLLAAYEQPYEPAFTDDASVVERYGQSIKMVEGNTRNIKITTPIDLVIGEQLLDSLY